MANYINDMIQRLEETSNEFDSEIDDFNSLYDALQYRPILDKNFLWAYGGEILSTSENNIEQLANYYERVYNAKPITGYYDPTEDERDNCVDEYTGNYYLDFD